MPRKSLSSSTWSGSQLIKNCIQYIRGSADELAFDWIGLVFGEAAGLGARLGLAIATFNIPGVISAVNAIIAYFGGNVPGQCKRLW